jgi:hypothetical protein
MPVPLGRHRLLASAPAPWFAISACPCQVQHSQTQTASGQSQIGSVIPIATPTATAKAIAAMRSVMENPRQAALTLLPVRFSGNL